ncbi:NAD(P)-dependent oxidoreductase [Enterovirga rhinocerotis]|uniref:3-hydroxyisobutyrate dehydrogenase-like beta-hydroxyacid dehydrogenase n=1 Tax=Enterovirga rhinocerotis TaxID=1339210 RepID=A0A4R7BWD4_9HYPH|nr:NAD(P)-dependent oxidoreductase [Enterovirga rhinocerotis]TDR89793.1 3-hydroxyisobutyrate dehydrogenase-like beta-hydroxyacid dehydrogenase [Enterovirga rhinocerotis]
MAGARLGFVGIGRMGEPMSGRLLDAGHDLVVFDTQPAGPQRLAARGATAVSSAKAVADEADVVFVSLPTPDIVKAVVTAPGGLIDGGRAKTIVDFSTTGPSTAKAIAEALAERGITWIDCPVSGGVSGAKGGTLAVIVSGPRATYDTLEPVLKVFGKLFHVGEKPGLAQSAKLANNLLAASALVVSSEAMAMAVKSGVDPQVMIDIINISSGRNSATQDKFPRSILPGTFDFGFTTGLSYKDVRLCIEEAEAMGIPMVAGSAVRQMLAVTKARYGADSDFTHIAKLLEEWAGVEMRSGEKP